jgi:hypothetical protein
MKRKLRVKYVVRDLMIYTLINLVSLEEYIMETNFEELYMKSGSSNKLWTHIL